MVVDYQILYIDPNFQLPNHQKAYGDDPIPTDKIPRTNGVKRIFLAGMYTIHNMSDSYTSKTYRLTKLYELSTFRPLTKRVQLTYLLL